MTTLNIAAMECWAPNADGIDAWGKWSRSGVAPSGDQPPPLKHIPPMQRRRLSLLARSVFHVGARCLDQAVHPSQMICMFANAYGQCSATVKMLETLARGAPTSPAAFSLSVHNAIAGQFSIAHDLQGASTSLSPGRDGLGGVMAEAAAWLNQSANDELLLCCFEEPIPDTLKPYQAQPPTPMAAAFLLSRHPSSTETRQFELARQTSLNDNDGAQDIPFWQQVLIFTEHMSRPSSPDANLRIDSNGVQYNWTQR